MKKILSVLLSIIFVFSAIPLGGLSEYIKGIDFGFLASEASAASYSGTCGTNVNWSHDTGTGVLTISGSGAMADFDIYFNFYYESYTSAPWSSSVKSVVIQNGVTSIGDWAFYNCSNLTSVTIGDSVTSIGKHAFRECSSLTSVTIPDSVTSIGDYAFRVCSKLTSVTIPDSVTSIGDSAFEDCSRLTSVKIPDSVTSIGKDAFYNCSSLTSVTIPDSVTSIGKAAFYGTAYYNNSANWVNNVLYIGNHLIKAKSDISGAYTVKSGTKCIAANAFYNCSKLTSVTIPDSVTSIGSNAFYGCSDDLIIYGYTGSYAHNYAVSNNIKFASTSVYDISQMMPVLDSAKSGNIGISVRWQAVNGADGYRIYRKTGSSADWKKIKDVGKVTVYVDSDVKNNTKYTYTVRAFKDGVFSKYDKNGISATFNSGTETKPLAAPVVTVANTLDSVNQINTYITVSWNAISGADGYKVYRKINDANKWTRIAQTGEKQYVDKNVTPGTTYTYTVMAYKGSTNGSYDTTGKKIINLNTPKMNSAKLNALSGGMLITWSKIQFCDGYYVFRKQKTQGDWSSYKCIYKVKSAGGIICNYTDKNIESGVQYRYCVKAYSQDSVSDFQVGGITAKCALAQPRVTVANANGGVTVEWTWDSAANGYYIYRKKTTDKSWERIKTVTPGTTSSYTDKTAVSGKAYNYTVVSYFGTNTSAANYCKSSFCTNVAVKYLAAGKVTSAQSTQTGITVKWNKVTGATGYKVYRKVGSGSWANIAALKGNATVSYVDESAEKGTTYTYCVRPVNGSFAGVYANTKSCTDKY